MNKAKLFIETGKSFSITYIAPFVGHSTTERITAPDYSTAKEIAESKGVFVSCEYIHTNTDLLYIH